MLSDQKSYGQRLFWICLDLPSQQDGSLAYSPQGPDSLFLIFSHIVFFFSVWVLHSWELAANLKKMDILSGQS